MLVYDSPDRILLSWKAKGGCEGIELEQLILGYASLNELNLQGKHQLKAHWQIGNSDSQPLRRMASQQLFYCSGCRLRRRFLITT